MNEELLRTQKKATIMENKLNAVLRKQKKKLIKDQQRNREIANQYEVLASESQEVPQVTPLKQRADIHNLLFNKGIQLKAVI